MTETWRTQRITAVDIECGRIRIPIGEKEPYPTHKDRVTVRLAGVLLREVAWDPRLGPDRERSGVLSVGRELATMVEANERLVVRVTDGVIDLQRS